MNCPTCKTTLLIQYELEPYLVAFTCENCHGDWLPAAAYHEWREGNVDKPERALPEDEKATLPVRESHQARLCPACGGLMLPYRVGHGLDFALDHCGHCGGTWLEENEWNQLQAACLHDNLHQVFTDVWQTAVRHAEQAHQHEQNLRDRFGDADYERVREIKHWLSTHSERDALRAFLTATEEHDRDNA